MCPACLASLAVLVSGGAFSAFLAWKSRPAGCATDLDLTEQNGEDHEPSDDRLAS